MIKIRTAVTALFALSFVWVLVWAVRATVATQVPTPDRVATKMQTFAQGADQDRSLTIDRIAQDYLRLSFLQKRQFRSAHRDKWDSFIAQLRPEEKEQFATKIFPARFTHLMAAFDRLSAERRAEQLERALQEFTTNINDQTSVQMMQKFAPIIIAEIEKNGLSAQFQKMPLETKLLFLPMIEQLQNNLRRMRD